MTRPKILLALWLLTDLIIFIGSYALAYFFRVGWIFSTDFPFERFIAAAAVVAPVWLIVLGTTRTFALARKQTALRNGTYIAYSCLVAIALFTLVYYFTFEQFFSRSLLLIALVLSTILTWTWHVFFSAMQRRILRRNPPSFPTLIVGVTRESKELIAALNRNCSHLNPVAILDGRGARETEIDGVPVRGKLNKLEDVLNEGITHLIQCSDLEQSLNLLSACRQKKITFILLPSVLGMIDHDERIDTLEGMPVTVVEPKRNRMAWFIH